MLKSTDKIAYELIEYAPNAKKRTIVVQLSTGRSVNNEFVPDGRAPLVLTIANISDRATRHTENLVVNVAGEVKLTFAPIDGNQIEIDAVAQDHESGQVVVCANNIEGDLVAVAYYYTVSGRDWFNEAAAFVKEDHPECAGMNDYNYNKHRVYTILTQMGLISGEII